MFFRSALRLSSKAAVASQRWAPPLAKSAVCRNLSGSSLSGGSPIPSTSELHGTTILSVRKGNEVVVIGDGQVSLGSTVVKGNARKVRELNDSVICGFAGATADCLTLLDKLESKLEEYPGQATRACVELAKMWRSEKTLRHLEAWMIVVDEKVSLTLTGNGNVLETVDGVVAIGSGGSYALAAARALMDVPDMTAEEVATKAMNIAADICVYTNHNFIIKTLPNKA